MYINRQRFTHSGRLERWIGTEQVEHLSSAMKDWYGPPIALAGVPGSVWAMKGGDFAGPIKAGQLATSADYVRDRLRGMLRRWAHGQMVTAHAFTSLSDILAAASLGQRNEFCYFKNSPTGVVAGTTSLWGIGATPTAGANAANAPGGEAPTDATTGAFPFVNAGGGDTQHWMQGNVYSGTAGSILVYDRIFQVNKTMNSNATESVTGVPTRYQSSTPGNADYAGGNFIFVEVGGTQLAATAHNWTTCLYRDEAGNDAQTMPSLTGNSAAIVRRLDHPLNQWFAPLATGDFGAMDLNQMQCSAAVATGVINFVIGHPIAWMFNPVVNLVCQFDGLNTALNLVRVFDDAALAILDVQRTATAARDIQVNFTTVHG